MTVQTTFAITEYDGTGAQTVFPIPFPFLQSSDIKVTQLDSVGEEYGKTVGTDFNIVELDVVMIVAPALLETLRIERVTPPIQPVDLRPNETFPEATVERALDRITMVCQEVKGYVERVVAGGGLGGIGGIGDGSGSIDSNNDGIPDTDLGRFLFRDIGDNKYNAKDFQVKNLASGENTTDAVNLGQMLEAISIGGGTNPDVDNPVTGNRINTQYGATYTLQPLDADGTVEMTSSSPNTVFIPAYNPLNAITEGKQFLMHQRGIGKMSIAPETGAVILRYNEKLLPNADGRFSTIWAQYRGNNEWHVGGELEPPVTPPTPPADPTPQPIPTIAVPTGNFRSSKKVTFKTDGDVTIIDNSNTETSIGRWFPAGVPTPSPASYDIFCTMIAGDMENNQSSSRNTWLSLGSNRVWVAEDSTSVRWMELRITVRVIATGVTATNTITVSRRT